MLRRRSLALYALTTWPEAATSSAAAVCTPQSSVSWGCDPTLAYALQLAAGQPGLVVDIGAHGGRQIWTALAAGRRVTAVECSVRTYMSLAKSFAGEPNATILHFCAGSSVHTAALHLADDSSSLIANNVAHGYEAHKARAAAKANDGIGHETVLVVPLDAVLLNATAPTALLKVDTQGTEYSVLAGAQELLARDRPVVMFEEEGGFARDGSARRNILQPLGYKCDFHYVRGLGKDFVCSTRLQRVQKPGQGLQLRDS